MWNSIKNLFDKTSERVAVQDSVVISDVAEETLEPTPTAETVPLKLTPGTNLTTPEPETEEVSVAEENIFSTEYLLSSPQVVGWLSTAEQELLFSALCYFTQQTNSFLDVGCGRADLYGYLQSILQSDQFQYKGIDLNPNLIEIAKLKFENVEVESTDILNYNAESYDWVVGSGLFNLNDHPDMIEYAKLVIDKMYEVCNVGVAVNFLTGVPEDLADEDLNALIIHDPGIWLNYLVEKYNKVIARADYLTGDITFYILK